MYTVETMSKFIAAFQSQKTTKLDYGWTYSDTFKVWQKVNNQVYCYVVPQFGRIIAQCYKRGDVCSCELEARCYSTENLPKLFELCDEWLERYGNDSSLLPTDEYAIGINFRDSLFEDNCK